MKKILLFTVLLISIGAFAQSTKTPSQLTQKTAAFNDSTIAQNGTTQGTTLQSIYNLFGVANKLTSSDTSFLHAQIVQLLNAKLNSADTSLLHAQIAQTVSAIATKLNISDTSFLHNQIAQAVAAIAANTTAIGNKADKATTLTINGTTFDLSANRSWTIAGGGSSTTLTDNLTTSTTGTALDAHQGFVLKGLIDGNTTAIAAKQDALTLTTTGTSGAATLAGSTLNIPQYAGSGSSNSTLKDVTTNGYGTPVFTKFGDTAFKKATDSTWFFGDSYTGGAFASTNAFRFSTLAAFYMSTNEVNKGIQGTTLQFHATGDSSMIERMYLMPAKTATHKALVFEYGTNDANAVWADTASFRSSYYRVIDTAIARGWSLNDIVLVTPGYYGQTFDQNRRIQYINMVKSVGAAKGVAVADAWSLLQSESPNIGASMYSDSLHPNDIGHRIFARAILNAYRGRHQSEITIHGRVNANYLSLYNNPNDNNPAALMVYDTASATSGVKPIAAELRVSNTQGSFAFGLNSLIANTTGQSNASFGKNTLQSNTTGSNNIAFGLNALPNNTTGSKNIAIGVQALQNNTTTSSNVAIGNTALTSATGGANIAVGDNAMNATTSGGNNAGMGHQVMQANTTGTNNVAVGSQAMLTNTTGTLNVAVGANTLNSATTATLNTALGWRSLFQATASNNTGLGARSLEGLKTGSNNTALGYFAGAGDTTGSNNVFIGANVANAASFAAYTNRLLIHNSASTTPLIDGTMGTTIATSSLTLNGKLLFPATNTATGTTGAQTINNPSGTVNIAAAGTSVTVTNSLVTTSSIVYCVIRTNDANNVAIKSVVPAAGSFIVNLTTAPAAEISIGFIVYN